MTQSFVSYRPGEGRTFGTVMGVVGLIASMQILALGYAFWKRGLADPGAGSPPGASGEPVPVEVSVPFPEVALVAPVAEEPALEEVSTRPALALAQPTVVEENPSLESFPLGTGQDPATTGMATGMATAVGEGAGPTRSVLGATGSPPAELGGPESLATALSVAARANEITEDTILERLLVAGAELRSSGNTQGAMKAFREVETALPNHPRVLAELGATLGAMGLAEKAGAYWQRIEGAGPLLAGAYYPIAGVQLRGETTVGGESAALPGASGAESDGRVFRIGEVKVEEQSAAGDDGEGQRVNLRIVVRASPESRPVGEDMALLVYFFDQVNEGAVLPSTADTSYLYPTEPYDWLVDGTEEILVAYHQPIFTDEQRADLGERRYFGYVIELYYRDHLQDRVVMPESISDLTFEEADSTGQVPKYFGPENALFPDSFQP